MNGTAPAAATSREIGASRNLSLAERVVKRAVDVAAASAGLAVLAPAFAAAAVAIKLDSPGPVFYRGERVGLKGRVFYIYKFRTMYVGSDRGSATTGLNDPRVTRVGRLLRDHKLDELPQLLNVLRGEMSLVGPRPEVVKYVNVYTPEERIILDVKPGITDLASLEFINLAEVVGTDDPDGYYYRHVFKKKNALRVKYAKERSLLLDASILARTLGRLGRGVLKDVFSWRR